jgi:flavin-dependent dehydrogenase
MSTVVAEHAIVIGAGMGGLAAANAVAPYFNNVSVLDRDALPEGPDVRPGTPQAKHAHACLPEARRRSKRCSLASEPTFSKRALSKDQGRVLDR